MVDVERDEGFYMTLVTIQVENCLFRIPRQSLESQSKIFRDMFSLPVSDNVEGSSDKNPIRLDGIKKDEFKRFLEVLLGGNPRASVRDYEETARKCSMSIFDLWFPVVKLSSMWEFERIHKYAINKMPYAETIRDPAEKVALAVQYDVQHWLVPGLMELAKRKEPLGNRDFEFLGPELTLKVAAIRESLMVTHGILIAGTRDATSVDFTQVINRVFKIQPEITPQANRVNSAVPWI